MQVKYGFYLGSGVAKYIHSGILYSDYDCSYTIGGHAEFGNLFTWSENLTVSFGLDLSKININKVSCDYSTYQVMNDTYYYLTTKGGKNLREGNYENILGKENLDLDFLSFRVPVYLNYYLNKSKIRPYLSFGVTPVFFFNTPDLIIFRSYSVDGMEDGSYERSMIHSYYANADHHLSDEEIETRLDNEYFSPDYWEYLPSVELGLLMKFGVDYQISNGSVFAEIQAGYYTSLDANSIDRSDAKQLSILLGYKF